MSRRRNVPNNVMGPTSALTSFLREHGINARNIIRPPPQQQQQPEQNVPPGGATPDDAGQPATNGDTNGDAQQQEQQEEQSRQEPEVVQGSSRRRTNGYNSDNLDESDDPDAEKVKKKRKLTKAAEAKLKAKEKAKEKAKRKKAGKGSDAEDDQDNDDADDDDDPYTAPAGKGIMNGVLGDDARPANGTRITCVDCDKLFVVTKYTLAGQHGGYICHPCAKKKGKDPFEKKAPKKRKPAAEKRNVVHYEEAEPVKSLTSLCIELIGKYIEDIEALGDIGMVNMDKICKIVSKSRMLNSHNVQLFYDTSRTSLSIYDGTNLQPPAYEAMAALNPNLERLFIHCCGQLESTVLKGWSQPNTWPNLTRIELYAPFLARVEAWKEFIISKGPQLKGFLVTNSPRFDLDCLITLQEHCSDHLEELRLSEFGKLDDTWLPYLSTFESLISLDLSRSAKSLENEATIELLSKIGPQLELLDLSGHDELTDEFLLEGLAKHSGNLQTLKLSGITQLTDEAVSNLFKIWLDPTCKILAAGDENAMDIDVERDVSNVSNPPLILLDLSQCHLLSTSALTSILAHSGSSLECLSINGWKHVEDKGLKRLCFNAPGLKELDLSWCRNVDDFLVNGIFGKGAVNLDDEEDQAMMSTRKIGCDKLKVLKVYGCNRLTADCPRKRDVLLLGVESDVFVRT